MNNGIENIPEKVNIRGKRDYNNAKIYKLVTDCNDLFYVGSTLMQLSKRFCNHKYDAKKHPEQRVYKEFNAIGWEHIKIILVEEIFNINSVELLRQREDEFIQMHKHDANCLNNNKAFGIDTVKSKKRINKYNQQNADKINEYRNTQQFCKECGGRYTNKNKSQHIKSVKHQQAIKKPVTI